MATPAAGGSAFAKLSPPVRVALGVFLGLIILAGYWLVFYSEITAKIEAAERQGQALNQELATQKEAQANYFADRDELALRQQRQRELNKALPAETEAAAFLSAIQQVSNVAGVDLKAWQPLEEKNEAFYAKVPMRLEMEGRFQQIAKFSYEMGKLERIINIEDIELTDPKVDGDEVKLKAKCLATTFHLPKKTTAPPRGAVQ